MCEASSRFRRKCLRFASLFNIFASLTYLLRCLTIDVRSHGYEILHGVEITTLRRLHEGRRMDGRVIQIEVRIHLLHEERAEARRLVDWTQI